jgi:Ras-related protein Rab-5C
MSDPKLVLLGDASVGKSSLLCRFYRNEFDPHVFTTIGETFVTHTFHLRGQDLTVRLWDTPGQDQYASHSALCVRDASACIVVYDVTRPDTFLHAQEHISRYTMNCKLRNSIVVVAGNKRDLLDPAAVDAQFAELAAIESGPCIRTFLVSAQSGEDVSELFQTVAMEIQRRYDPVELQTPAAAKAIGSKTPQSGCC